MELKQYLNMSQQLVMTPQMVQAIHLLQLNRVELETALNEQLLENPVLEIDDGAEQAKKTEEREEASEPLTNDDDFDWENFAQNYAEYSGAGEGDGSGGYREDTHTEDQTASHQATLAEHLYWQLSLRELDPDTLAIAKGLVGNLNDDGYIQADLAELAADMEYPEAQVEETLTEVIHDLDPLGVGARNVRECLLIQAKHYFPRDTLVHAIIQDHLEDIEQRNTRTIYQKLDCDEVDLRSALDLIRRLEPRPGRNFVTQSESAVYVTPDVFIAKIGDEYVVQVNEDGLPKLRINRFYQRQLKDRGDRTGQEDMDFLQERIKAAMWLIRSIHQRNNTIRRVTESIALYQREFLDQGITKLRPLTLQEVADHIGMHESTISRVTTGKYVHTPQGTFELKYFFNSGIPTLQGGIGLASESVRQLIKDLIEGEDPKKPLSDMAISKILNDKGMSIARRTVAKYRETLKIPPSSRRKGLF